MNTESEKVRTSNTVLPYYNLNLPVNLSCVVLQYGTDVITLHIMKDGGEYLITFTSCSLPAAEK